MTVLTAILGTAAGVDPLVSEEFFFNWSTLEGKVVLGAIILVVLGLALWAIYALAAPRKSHRHRRRRHHHRSSSDHEQEGHDDDSDSLDSSLDAEDSPENEESHSQGHRHRRRRRRREHRPRNPTLAETGGLPPIRTDAPPGP